MVITSKSEVWLVLEVGKGAQICRAWKYEIRSIWADGGFKETIDKACIE